MTGFWRVTHADGSVCYVTPDDLAFNGADGVLHLVGDLPGSPAWGAEACAVEGDPPSALIYRPALAFDGLTVTHVADPLHLDTAYNNTVNALTALAQIVAPTPEGEAALAQLQERPTDFSQLETIVSLLD